MHKNEFICFVMANIITRSKKGEENLITNISIYHNQYSG